MVSKIQIEAVMTFLVIVGAHMHGLLIMKVKIHMLIELLYRFVRLFEPRMIVIF